MQARKTHTITKIAAGLYIETSFRHRMRLLIVHDELTPFSRRLLVQITAKKGERRDTA